MALIEKECKHKLHPGNRLLPIIQFNKRGKGYQSYCISCQSGYAHTHYDNNKNYYADKRDKWRDKDDRTRI